MRFPVRHIALLALLSATVALAAAPSKPVKAPPPCPSAEEKPDPFALMTRSQEQLDGQTAIMTMKMDIVTPAWKRSLTMKTWGRGRDFALVRIVAGGPRETGMMTLKREKQLWNYLPQAGRVMKLPSGMMGDSWMGSDFTNDDLVRGTSLADDFTGQVDKVVDHQGHSAWHITLVPKPSAAVVWSKVEVVLDRKSCIPFEQRFYDEEGAVARRMVFEDFKTQGWRTYATKMTVLPVEKGRLTVITYEAVEYDVDIPDDTFSLRRLQQGR